jgi:hypothetical protein
MIIEAGKASRLSLIEDNHQAGYKCTSTLVSIQPPGAAAAHSSIRVTLELRRAFGGMIMRALIGGEFVPTPGGVVRFEVQIAAAPFDSGVAATCESELGKPLVPGLPEDFAPSVLAGLGTEEAPLPPGTLLIDRAGYDLMGSSESAFYQVARLLRAAVAATLADNDVPAVLTLLLADIPVDAHA